MFAFDATLRSFCDAVKGCARPEPGITYACRSRRAVFDANRRCHGLHTLSGSANQLNESQGLRSLIERGPLLPYVMPKTNLLT